MPSVAGLVCGNWILWEEKHMKDMSIEGLIANHRGWKIEELCWRFVSIEDVHAACSWEWRDGGDGEGVERGCKKRCHQKTRRKPNTAPQLIQIQHWHTARDLKVLTQVLSEFGLQADLQQLVFEQHTVIFTHEPAGRKQLRHEHKAVLNVSFLKIFAQGKY